MTVTAPRKPGELATRLLQHMRDGDVMDVRSLASALQDRNEKVAEAAALLRRRGLLKTERIGHYRLTQVGMDASRCGAQMTSGPQSALARVGQPDDTLQGRAWWAMRYRKRFTIGDLVSDAERGEANAARAIGQFVRNLLAAGYLRGSSRRTPRPSPGKHGLKEYQLVRNAGPLTPVWRAANDAVYDPNDQEWHPCTRG